MDIKYRLIKAYAHKQFYEEVTNDTIGFQFKDQFIVDPWTDPAGFFALSTDEAIDMYGLSPLLLFIDSVSCLFHGLYIEERSDGMISVKWPEHNICCQGTFREIMMVLFKEIDRLAAENEQRATMSVEDLRLSSRTFNALYAYFSLNKGMSLREMKASELASMPLEELQSIKNLGGVSLSDLKNKLEAAGFNLAWDKCM